jgi:hypothetical protein
MFATVDKVFPCPDAREGIHSAGVATSPSHQVRCLLTNVPLSRTDLELLTEEFTPCREDCVVLPTARSSFLQQVLLDEPLHIQSSKSLLNELIESKSL